MMKIRNIPDETPIDLSKVRLGVKFDNDINVKYSELILDKARFWIVPSLDVPTRTICSFGSHIIYIHHNASIRKDTKLQLQIIRQTENDGLVLPEPIVTSFDHAISPNLIKFKINMDDTLDHAKDTFKAILHVKVDDEDVPRLSFNDLQSLESPVIKVRVAVHMIFKRQLIYNISNIKS